MQRTAIDAGALACGGLPSCGGLDVRGPEGPGAALDGAEGVDGAGDGAGFFTQEEFAIAVRFFEQAQTLADAADVRPSEVLERDAQVPGDGVTFGERDPYVARCAGAAFAAAGALEAEAVSERGRAVCGSVHACFPQHFLYFLPEPQGQGSLRPTVWSRLACSTGTSGIGASSSETTVCLRRFSSCFRS